VTKQIIQVRILRTQVIVKLSVPLYKHIFKERRILNSSSKSEENTAEAATSKQKKNANKFSWTRENFQLIIHEFDDENSEIKVNNQSFIFDIFQIIFLEEIIEFIVESNKYYKNGLSDHNKFNVHNCNITTVPEICFFFTMLMTRIHKISLSEYWTKDKLIRTIVWKNNVEGSIYIVTKNPAFL